MSACMGSVADRIREVIDRGTVPSARAWCVRAGISGSYLGTFLTRDRQGVESDIGVGTLSKLAGAAGVSFTWLALGEGSPNDVLPPLPANLQAAVEKRKDIPDVLIRQARMVLAMTGEDDLSVDAWLDYIDGLRREARRVGLEAAAARLEQRGIGRR
jgi:hypothetical protein